MENLPSSMLGFERQFATEDACKAFLADMRWRDGFACPLCQAGKWWLVRGGLRECAACGHQTSVTAGTVFHGSRVPLTVWFRALALMVTSKQGCSAKELHRLLGVGYKTAWLIGHKLRVFMKAPQANRLKGRVEVDESYFGGEDDAAHKGRSVSGHKACVVVAVEDKGTAMGRLRMEQIPDATATSLGDFTERNVAPTATLHTDGFQSYKTIAKKSGRKHDREIVGNPKNASKMFPKVHRVFSLARRVLVTTYQGAVSRKHRQAYLDEFVFRFNRRSSANRFLLFARLLERTFTGFRTYAQIIGRVPLTPLRAGLAA